MAGPTSVPQQLKQAETDIAVLQVRFTNLDEKIAEIKTDITGLREDIEESSDKAITLIREFQADNIKSHKEMSSKISNLEKWRWMIMGAGIVIGSLGSFVLGILF